MAKNYKAGIVITGDAKGGVKAVNLTGDALAKLNKSQKTNRVSTRKSKDENKSWALSYNKVAAGIGFVSSAVAGYSLQAVIRDTVAVTRETDAWARAVGVSTQTLTQWNYVGEQAALQQGKMGDIFKDTSEKIADAYMNGAGEAAEVIENLGLKTKNLIVLSPEKQLLAIGDALESLETRGQKIQVLESLASDASLLLPYLEDDAKLLHQVAQEALVTGKAISNIEASQLVVIGKEFNKLAAQSTGLGNNLSVALSPAIYGATQEINRLTGEWGGMGNMADKAVDLAVGGLGVVLDVGQEVRKLLKVSEIRWLHMGKVGLDAFVGMGQAGVDLLNLSMQPIRTVLGTIVKGWGYLIDLAADVTGNEAWKEAAKFALGYGDAIKTTIYKMGDFVGLQKKLEAQLVESHKELDDLLEAKAPSDELNEWLARNKEELKKVAIAALEAAAAKDVNSASTKTLVNANNDLKHSLGPVAQIYKDTATSIRGAWRGAFRDILDNQNSFADRMLNVFKDLLADMATMAITQPIIIPMVQGLGGLLGVPGASQAAVAQQLGGGGGSLLSGAAGIAATTGGVSALGTFGTGAMAGLNGGFGAASALSGTTTLSTTMGAYAGAALPWVAGALAVNQAIKNAGHGDWETKGSGFNLDYSGGRITGESFEDQRKYGGWFHSDRHRTTTEELSADASGDLNFAFDNIENSLTAMADSLGLSAKAVESFTTSTSISLHGLSEQDAAAAIDEWVSGVADEMASSLFGRGGINLQELFESGNLFDYFKRGLDDFQAHGESLYQTLQRLTAETATVDGVLDALGLDLSAMFKTLYSQSEYATDLVDAAGGGDRLVALTNKYLETFHTPEELIEKALTDATTGMDEMLSGLGAGRDGFRAQFEAVQGSLAPDDLVAWLEAAGAIALVTDLEKNLADVRENALIDGVLDGMVGAFRLAAGELGAIHASLTAQISATRGSVSQSIARVLGTDVLSIDDMRAQLGVGSVEDQIGIVNGLRDAIVSRYDVEAQAAEQAHQDRLREYEQLKNMANRLHGYVENLLVSDLSPLTNEQRLSEAKRQYGSLLLSARAGDATALSGLQGASSTYLKEAQGFYASSDQYSSIFDSVRSELGSVADGVLSRPAPELSTAELAAQLLDLQGDAVSSLQQLGLDLVALQAQADDELQTGLEGLEEQFSIDMGSVVAGLKENANLTSAPIVDAMAKLEQQQVDTVNLLAEISAEVSGAATQASEDAAGQTDALVAMGNQPNPAAVA